ncbi:hypothetical protein GDO81_027125 [Engystomops pustulosus]|uniref:Ig-like domain-containing protein n=1 Tax=Engystomops pustulosus TaxID=76066 RepID=A0AAV6ZEW9_ENGPU|nr:hypothetical protein GDO81_027125 [Engystomops pustulosus]KAG8547909.1 hypothetical protein GDO81_027125 [Engystomops pustulosus]
MDFRANLQRQVKPKALSEDERKVHATPQVDFRSVLGKKTPVSKPPIVEKTPVKAATPDFRSVLGNKKKVPTENGNANSTEPHENAKPFSRDDKLNQLVKDDKPKSGVKEENAKPVLNQTKGLFNQEKVKPLALKDDKPKPSSKEENAKPAAILEKVKPPTKEESTKPVVNQEKTKPLSKEESIKPAVNQEKMKPPTKEENTKPAVNQEKAKVTVKEEIAKTVENLEKVRASPKEEKLKPAVNEENSRSPLKEDVAKTPALEEKPSPTEEQIQQNCVYVVDGEVESKATAERTSGTPPLFSEVLQDAKLVDGEKLILQCRVTSDPPPTVTWTLDGKVIKSSKFIVLGQEGSLYSLTIDKTFPEDGGQYTCVAENAAGKSGCSCNVTVEDTSGKTGITKTKKPKSNAAPTSTSESK